jgi:hypothetical protein
MCFVTAMRKVTNTTCYGCTNLGNCINCKSELPHDTIIMELPDSTVGEISKKMYGKCLAKSLIDTKLSKYETYYYIHFFF